MITSEWVHMMARYNAWQNNGLWAVLNDMDPAALTEDRGAFFGSILATANHILWADLTWMHRIEGWTEAPNAGRAGTEITDDLGDWVVLRADLDARIMDWAETARTEGDVTFDSGLLGKGTRRPRAFCITHMFNHQTHHRGQIHAMVTSAGYRLPDTDLLVLPQES